MFWLIDAWQDEAYIHYLEDIDKILGLALRGLPANEESIRILLYVNNMIMHRENYSFPEAPFASEICRAISDYYHPSRRLQPKFETLSVYSLIHRCKTDYHNAYSFTSDLANNELQQEQAPTAIGRCVLNNLDQISVANLNEEQKISLLREIIKQHANTPVELETQIDESHIRQQDFSLEQQNELILYMIQEGYALNNWSINSGELTITGILLDKKQMDTLEQLLEQHRYEVCLKKKDAVIKNNVIYVELAEERGLQYTVIDPSGKLQSGLISKELISSELIEPLTLDQLNHSVLVKLLVGSGHIIPTIFHLNFSDTKFTTKDGLPFFPSLNFSPIFLQLQILTLFNCDINDTTIEDVLVRLLAQLLNLRNLQLQRNIITYKGAILLAKTVLPFLKDLTHIDLSHNLISCVLVSLNELKNDFEKSSSLQTVQISQNYMGLLFREKDTFKKNEEESKSTTDTNPIYSYGLFKTQANPANSLLDKNLQITPQKWLVAYASRKKELHAEILMEGMYKNGQRFLERYHITSNDIVGYATASIKHIYPDEFNPEEYYLKITTIDKIKGIILKRLVTEDVERGKDIPFALVPRISTSLLSEKDNCTKWCIKKLKKINIVIDPNFFDIPSISAGKNYCDLVKKPSIF